MTDLVARSISDDVLITINTIELVGIIYLAIAVSMLRERIARIEGRMEQERRDQDRGTRW